MATETSPQKDPQVGNISLTTDGGVSKTILQPAPSDSPSPKDGFEVSVHYVGTLMDGSQFDSSRERDQPFKFNLGAGSVIRGWDIGLKSMRIGEKCHLFCRPDYAYGKNGSKPNIPPDATLRFEIELLAINAPSVTSGGEVTKEVLEKGTGYDTPKADAKATINLRAFAQNREKEAFLTLNNAETELDDQFQPKGLKKALLEMKKGEKALITVKPGDYHYPDSERPDGVNADDELYFETELVSFKNKKAVSEMSDSEKLEEAVKAKADGNAFFKSGEFKPAARRYKYAVECLENLPGMVIKENGEVDPQMAMQFMGMGLPPMDRSEFKPELTPDQQRIKTEAEPIALAVLNNLSLLKEKEADHSSVIESCGKALKIDPRNVKALFRRGKALASAGRLDEALADMETAAKEKDCALFRNFCAELKRRKRDADSKVDSLYKRMFEGVAIK